jgi:hypothetical protein
LRERKGGGGGRQARLGGGKRRKSGPSPRVGRERENTFFFLFFHLLLKSFERIFKTTLNLKKHHSIKSMQQHECTSMCLGLIVNFNSIKLISYYFSVLANK